MKRITYSLLALFLIASHTQCTETQYPAGKRYYDAYCGNCHMADGNGLSKLIPSLNKSLYLSEQQNSLPCIIRYGIKSAVPDSSSDVQLSMPAHPQINDIEVLNICNYINNTWGNSINEINMAEMKNRLDQCSKNKN